MFSNSCNSSNAKKNPQMCSFYLKKWSGLGFVFPHQNILLVQRQMSVKEKDVEQFQQALKVYTDTTSSQLDNLQYVLLSARRSRCDMMQPHQIASTLTAYDKPCFPLFLSQLFYFLFLAFPSRTCQTDHASSCTNFGRTVSPGWGRITGTTAAPRLSLEIYSITEKHLICSIPLSSQLPAVVHQ